MVSQQPLVTDHATIGGTPGAPNAGIPPRAGAAVDIRALLRQEYVAGGGYSSYANYIRSLPWAIDDVTGDFGDDLYQRMLYEAQVASTISVLKASILEEGLELSPAVIDADLDGYDQAVAIQEACSHWLDELATPLDDVLWNLLDAIAMGNRVAEQVYDYDRLPSGRTQLALVALKVKPRRATSFVVDVYNNLLGLLAQVPGIGAPVLTGSVIMDPKQLPNILPREKFAILTFRPVDNDPRGTSVLRGCYDPWWRKQQIKVEYLKYLAQFAGPSLIGYTAPDAQQYTDIDSLGNPADPTLPAPASPETQMLTSLLAFRNGTAAAFPAGASVQVIQSQGEGKAFLDAMRECDKEIVRAILTAELATNEGQHQSRAASQTHQDAQDTIIRQAKRGLVRTIRRDILRPLVRYNYGEAAATRLVPQATLGEVERHDFPQTAGAVAALESAGYVDPSQYAGIDELLNLPARDPESIAAAIQLRRNPPPAVTQQIASGTAAQDAKQIAGVAA